MQITREASTRNVIRAWESGRIKIGEQWINGHLIVSGDKIVSDWLPADPQRPTIEDLESALAMNPEIIVLGLATLAPIPDIDLMAALADRSIGLEIMTTPAACRTYNVLVHEHRRVVAALCVDTSTR